MPHYPDPYCFGYALQADGSLAFECSQDADRWRWLALPPHHPAVIQTQNFWGSIGAITHLDGAEASKWSALTWTDWACGYAAEDHAVRGVYRRTEDEEGESFSLAFYDARDREIVRTDGRGVIFRKRNFEAWRAEAKRKAKAHAGASGFTFADRAGLGLSLSEYPFVTPLETPEASMMQALVTREIGLPPGNPHFSGSGDHVNTTHFAEIARQVACLITGNAAVMISGGEMSLTRYVELGTPIDVVLDRAPNNRLTLELAQLGQNCANIAVEWSETDT